jgi:nucleoside-diphosphate-sugar epimerase
MNIIIFGGSGFIGHNLFNQLSGSNEITVFDKVRRDLDCPNFIIGNVQYPIHVNQAENFDVIVNLAAEHADNVLPKSLYSSVNVGGAVNICNFARENGINKIIFTSSVAVYGEAQIGANEDSPIQPFNEYGATKFQAEEVYRLWLNESPTERTLTIIRPTVVFGPGNRGNVFNLFRQIFVGKFIMISPGLNRKSMAYVDNVAAFIKYCLNFNSGYHLYNYVDKPDYKMKELVAEIRSYSPSNNIINLFISKLFLPYSVGLLIASFFDFFSSLTGKQFAISRIRIKKFCMNSVYSTRVADLSFIAPVHLDEAIKRTIDSEFLSDPK